MQERTLRLNWHLTKLGIWTTTWLVYGNQFNANPSVLIMLHAFYGPKRMWSRSRKCNKEIKRLDKQS